MVPPTPPGLSVGSWIVSSALPVMASGTAEPGVSPTGRATLPTSWGPGAAGSWPVTGPWAAATGSWVAAAGLGAAASGSWPLSAGLGVAAGAAGSGDGGFGVADGGSVAGGSGDAGGGSSDATGGLSVGVVGSVAAGGGTETVDGGTGTVVVMTLMVVVVAGRPPPRSGAGETGGPLPTLVLDANPACGAEAATPVIMPIWPTVAAATKISTRRGCRTEPDYKRKLPPRRVQDGGPSRSLTELALDLRPGSKAYREVRGHLHHWGRGRAQRLRRDRAQLHVG